MTIARAMRLVSVLLLLACGDDDGTDTVDPDAGDTDAAPADATSADASPASCDACGEGEVCVVACDAAWCEPLPEGCDACSCLPDDAAPCYEPEQAWSCDEDGSVRCVSDCAT